MFAYVSGTLVSKKPTAAVIEAGGIGYRLLIPASSYERLPAEGKTAKLMTAFVVREDSQTLYGFATAPERELFEILTGVSGIGPKLGLAALSGMNPAELRDAVVAGDDDMLTRIPGVGKKTAARLIVELRDKLDDLDHLEGAAPISGGDDAAARADARAGLEALGLSRAQAEKRIRKVLRDHDDVTSAEALIRIALREG